MLVTDRDLRWLERLNRHPVLRARMESLLCVVEDAAGDLEKADAAERRVIEELRQMGNEALAAWAERGVEKSVAAARVEPKLRSTGKKTLLAHDLRPNRCGRACVAEWHTDRATFQHPCGDPLPRQFAAIATGDE